MSFLLRSTWLTAPLGDRLRVGECIVDVPLREVLRPDGSSTRLTLKSIGVLLVLAEHAGRVVTREALLESVWAGTLPTIDVVTQAVVSLRKALAGDGEATASVETIPKTGYRLLLPVEWLPPDGAPAHSLPPPPAASQPRRRMRGVVLAGVPLLAALAWSVAGLQDTPAPRSDAAGWPSGGGDVPYTLLTSRPGLEVHPTLSPDGASMAYSMVPEGRDRSYAIFVQSAEPTPPRQLTTPPPGHADWMPRWSPDGHRIMFARVDDQGRCEFRLLPATGGPERAVGSCDHFNGGSYDWLPDGSGIVAGIDAGNGNTPSPLSILRLDTGRWEPMSYPIAPGNSDYDPRFSSDGKRLGFRRNIVRAEIRVMPAQGGPLEQATRLRSEIEGWDWAPDDRSLFVSLGNGASRLVRYDLATHRSQTLGRFPAGSLDVAPRGGKLVFTVGEAPIAMFRYPLPLRAGAKPQPLFPSTGNDLLPSPSPDGRTIAFHSDRSRETRLWIGEPGAPDRLRMVDGLSPLRMHPVYWSEDGRRLLLVADPAEPGDEPGPRLYEVDVASGRSSLVALEGIPYVVQYIPGDRLLALVDLGSGRWSLRILDRASPGRVLAQLEGIGEARFDAASGQVYFVYLDSPGLWRTDTTLSAPVRIDDKAPSSYWMTQWAVLDGKVLSLRTAPGCRAQWYWIGPPAKARTGCLDPDRMGVGYLALVPSQRGDWLYASMSLKQANRDIGTLDLDDLGGFAAATP